MSAQQPSSQSASETRTCDTCDREIPTEIAFTRWRTTDGREVDVCSPECGQACELNEAWRALEAEL